MQEAADSISDTDDSVHSIQLEDSDYFLHVLNASNLLVEV